MTSSLRLTILTIIAESDDPLFASEIADRLPSHSARRVRAYLTILSHEGAVSRERVPMAHGGFAYVYSISDKPFDLPDDGWPKREQEEFVHAINRARPHRRKGEMFTPEQKQEYRERFGRLRSHGPIWCGLRK